MHDRDLNEKVLLQVENLKMHFPVRSGFLRQNKSVVKAVDGVSFEIHAGETFGLVGESGCGKTTVGKCILGILNPTGGKICFDGREISASKQKSVNLNHRDIQLIFQDPYGSLDPRQSAYAMLKEALLIDTHGLNQDAVTEKINSLLQTVGLSPEIGMRYPHELSGGQRQRLGIARALACDPKLIVCDEPVSALDVSIQAQIINLFRELQDRLGLTYLFVAHDLAVVRHIANRIGVMYLGELVEVIEAADLYTEAIHPYTLALLSAVPTTDYYAERERTRIILQGEVPSPTNKPAGCPFHPRCIYATDKCRSVCPELRNVGEGHFVSCHNMESVQLLKKDKSTQTA